MEATKVLVNVLIPTLKLTVAFLRNIYKQIQRSPTAKRCLIVLLIFLLVYFWIIFIKRPKEAEIRAAEVTEHLTKILGTRITAVQLMPNENTTRLQPSYECNAETFAVILITSTAENYLRRRTLRNTWLKDLPTLDVRVKAFFFIGFSSDRNITTDLIEEAHAYDDIIVEDLVENYFLLALKTLRMAKWFSNNCIQAEYYIKTDDDMLLNVPNIIGHINKVPQSWVQYIGGKCHFGAQVNRDPYAKWFVPRDWWPEDEFPPYCTGALTVITSDVVPALLNASLTVPLFHMEDVYFIGMVGFNKLNIVPKDMPGIISGYPKWKLVLKMALWPDYARNCLAFHFSNDMQFVEELYRITKSE